MRTDGWSNGWGWDYGSCFCGPSVSPIVIDLDGDGFEFTSPQNGVKFDLLNDSIKRTVGWTVAAGRDAFLALDRNQNGTIDNGNELFGNITEQASPDKKSGRNGFLALSAYDTPGFGGNQDGKITHEDSIYADLRLWLDDNHDGISQSTELSTLSSLGVQEISLKYHTSKRADEHGNLLRYYSDVIVESDPADRRRAAARRLAVDVFFRFID